jgi:hypothetical protein
VEEEDRRARGAAAFLKIEGVKIRYREHSGAIGFDFRKYAAHGAIVTGSRGREG